jgi:hypothetical protein
MNSITLFYRRKKGELGFKKKSSGKEKKERRKKRKGGKNTHSDGSYPYCHHGSIFLRGQMNASVAWLERG